MESELKRIPDIVDETLRSQEGNVQRLAKKYRDARYFFFLGRGISMATALEGRLKLMEIAYVPTIAYPAGESITGEAPILVVNDGEARLIKIGEFVDRCFQYGEEGSKPVNNVYALGVDEHFKVKLVPVAAVARHKAESVFEIKYTGGVVRATGDHSVFSLTDSGIVPKRVNELKVGDVLVTYRTANISSSTPCVIDISELMFDVESERKKLQYKTAIAMHTSGSSISEIAKKLGRSRQTIKDWVSNRRKPWRLKEMGMPKLVEVTPELMRLFGYYLSEGCVWETHGDRVLSFSFNSKEVDKVEDVITLVRKYFNVMPTAITHPEPTETCIVYQRKRLVTVFKKLFGCDARSKRIPGFFLRLPRGHILEFLRGVLCDGYFSREDKITLATVSKDLAIEIAWFLKLHGINGSMMKKRSKERVLSGRVIPATDCYIIQIAKADNPFGKDKSRGKTLADMVPTALIRRVYNEARPVIPNRLRRPWFNSIIYRNKLASRERVERALRLIMNYRRFDAPSAELLEKFIKSDLGCVVVKEINEQQYDGYVYDLCGCVNEAFFGGSSPILLHNSKHGPISLIEPKFPVVFICPPDETRKALMGNIMEMKARGASIIAIVEEGDERMKQLADDYVEVPRGTPDVLSPIPYVVPLQLLAYCMAVERGCDPDRPRSLAKSVTVK